MRIPRKAAVALLAGVCIAGVAGASAASLGGATSGSLGADTSVIASCDSDGINLGYSTGYNAAAQRYEVTAVNFTNVNTACNGKAASITLTDTAGASLGSATSAAITMTGTGFSLSVPPGVDAKAVTGAAVVISG